MKIGKDGRPVMDEESVVKACVDLLRLNGARVHRVVERIPPGKHKYERKSEGGIPDLFFWWPVGSPHYRYGTVYMEVKRPGGKPNPSQIKWLGQALEDGRVAFWADSVDKMVQTLDMYGIVLKAVPDSARPGMRVTFKIGGAD